jgi:Bacterial antitoxin of type II TA system, VapB
MRTNIVIDDKLMSEAMAASGARTKREAVEMGLTTLLQMSQQRELLKYRGKLIPAFGSIFSGQMTHRNQIGWQACCLQAAPSLVI